MSGTDDRHWDRIVNLSMFIQKRWHERFAYCTVVISLNNLMCWVFFFSHTIAVAISPFMTVLMLWI